MADEKKITGEGVDFERYWYPAGATEPVLRPEVAAREKAERSKPKKSGAKSNDDQHRSRKRNRRDG